MSDRYSRQEAFYGIGKPGQRRLLKSRVVIIGMGALGTVTADHLARAGVGYLRLVDRDYVEISNLQRQMLYTEEDAANEVPKAEAAAAHLREANSGIEIEAVVTDFNSSTVDALISDMDLIMDATDNLETRYLLNEACRALKKNWIYGGAIGSMGMTCNFLYSLGSPCLNCITDPSEEGGESPTCVTAGVLNSTTAIVSSIQCAEALKILTGADGVRKTLIFFDLWKNQFQEVPVLKNPDCPVCVDGNYRYYGKVRGMEAVSLCGRNQVQVIPEKASDVDFEAFRERLAPLGTVKVTGFTLDFDHGDFSIKLFRNGRAIISNVNDVSRAKSIYTEYIGT